MENSDKKLRIDTLLIPFHEGERRGESIKKRPFTRIFTDLNINTESFLLCALVGYSVFVLNLSYLRVYWSSFVAKILVLVLT